jgi:hypothetical protein
MEETVYLEMEPEEFSEISVQYKPSVKLTKLKYEIESLMEDN